MKIQDYEATKRLLELLQDPKFLDTNSKTIEAANNPLWTWNRILLIKQLRAEFGLYLKDAKRIVDNVIEKVVANEVLLGKLKER